MNRFWFGWGRKRGEAENKEKGSSLRRTKALVFHGKLISQLKSIGINSINWQNEEGSSGNACSSRDFRFWFAPKTCLGISWRIWLETVSRWVSTVFETLISPPIVVKSIPPVLKYPNISIDQSISEIRPNHRANDFLHQHEHRFLWVSILFDICRQIQIFTIWQDPNHHVDIEQSHHVPSKRQDTVPKDFLRFSNISVDLQLARSNKPHWMPSNPNNFYRSPSEAIGILVVEFRLANPTKSL